MDHLRQALRRKWPEFEDFIFRGSSVHGAYLDGEFLRRVLIGTFEDEMKVADAMETVRVHLGTPLPPMEIDHDFRMPESLGPPIRCSGRIDPQGHRQWLCTGEILWRYKGDDSSFFLCRAIETLACQFLPDPWIARVSFLGFGREGEFMGRLHLKNPETEEVFTSPSLLACQEILDSGQADFLLPESLFLPRKGRDHWLGRFLLSGKVFVLRGEITGSMNNHPGKSLEDHVFSLKGVPRSSSEDLRSESGIWLDRDL